METHRNHCHAICPNYVDLASRLRSYATQALSSPDPSQRRHTNPYIVSHSPQQHHHDQLRHQAQQPYAPLSSTLGSASIFLHPRLLGICPDYAAVQNPSSSSTPTPGLTSTPPSEEDCLHCKSAGPRGCTAAYPCIRCELAGEWHLCTAPSNMPQQHHQQSSMHQYHSMASMLSNTQLDWHHGGSGGPQHGSYF